MTAVTDQERAEIRRAIELVLLDSGSSRFSIMGTVVPIEVAGPVIDRLLATMVAVVERIQDSEPTPADAVDYHPPVQPIGAMLTGYDLTRETWDALSAVIAERLRQIEVEGFTPDLDRHHEHGALAAAGATYLMPEDRRILMGGQPIQWPFEEGRYKPADRDRDIVRGLALGLAELERLRAEGS